MVKNPPANAGDARDVGSILESGRPLRVGNGNPLQYHCLENPMDRGAWQATVHGVAKESDTTQNAHAIVSLYFVAQGDICPGKSTAVKGLRFQSVSYTLLLRIHR